jgi:MSHA pilin protein MshA
MKQSGFTLIELVIVVVVIGVLAGAALPKYVDFTDDAKLNALQSQADVIRQACALNQSYKNAPSGSKAASNYKSAAGTCSTAVTSLLDGGLTNNMQVAAGTSGQGGQCLLAYGTPPAPASCASPTCITFICSGAP